MKFALLREEMRSVVTDLWTQDLRLRSNQDNQKNQEHRVLIGQPNTYKGRPYTIYRTRCCANLQRKWTP